MIFFERVLCPPFRSQAAAQWFLPWIPRLGHPSSYPPNLRVAYKFLTRMFFCRDPNKMYITNGRNTFQQEFNNLGAEAVTRCVGGMATHW